MAVQGGVVLVLELPTGGLADSIGRRRVLLVASALDVVALVWFANASSLAAFAGRGRWKACSGPSTPGRSRPGTSTRAWPRGPTRTSNGESPGR